MSIVLESERLRMTPVVEADWELFHRLHTSDEVMRYVSDPLPKEEIRARFDVRLLPWEKEQPHWLCLAIREKSSGSAVGVMGIRPEWTPFQQAEVGFLLLPEFQGRGYASESLGSRIREMGADTRYALPGCSAASLLTPGGLAEKVEDARRGAELSAPCLVTSATDP